jgi:DNA-binding GntR family transcriptional regulator
MAAQLVRLQSAPDLVDQVHQALLDAICDGTLAPGERITQEALADQLAVSRQPVVQALRLLKKDGFVLDAPGRGLVVSSLDGDDIVALYQVRGALDELSAQLAAERRCAIDPRLIEQGRRAARGRSLKAMIDADLAFHAAIYAASGNPLVERSATLHWAHSRRVMGAVLQSATERDSIWDEHEAILRAITEGNAARAAQLSGQHSSHAGRKLAAHLGQARKNHERMNGETS